jgi:hypothetical protein
VHGDQVGETADESAPRIAPPVISETGLRRELREVGQRDWMFRDVDLPDPVSGRPDDGGGTVADDDAAVDDL